MFDSWVGLSLLELDSRRLEMRFWAFERSSGRAWRRTGSKAAIVHARSMISVQVLLYKAGKVEQRVGKPRIVARWGVVSAR